MKTKTEIEVQVSPFGEFEKDGVTQICDEAAFQKVLENFGGREVLVDFDHGAETGGSTVAAAWLSELRLDPEKGLMGRMRLTSAGAEAVEGREYRFLSPCWTVGADGRPEQLISVGLTNKPNIPVRALLNRAAGAITNVEQPKQPKPNNNMEKILEALGLAPEAGEEEILAAIADLKGKLAQCEAERLENEAEKAVEESPAKEVLENRAAWKHAYMKDPETTRMLLNSLRPAPAAKPQRVYNTAAAKVPELPRTGIDARAEMASLPTRERAAFYAAHRAEIDG